MTRWGWVLALALMVAGVPAIAASISELQKSATAGNAKAQYELGVKYEYGQGVDKNYGKAADWTRKSAEQGFADAQYNYGLMLEYGQGVGKNYGEADKWYARAEAQGMVGATQARGMIARKLNPPAAPSNAGSGQAAAASGPENQNSRSGNMGSSKLSDRERLLERNRRSSRPDR